MQYADFAVWQRDWLTGPELERQVAFWRAHLAGAPVLLDLPLDRPRPRLQSYRGSRAGPRPVAGTHRPPRAGRVRRGRDALHAAVRGLQRAARPAGPASRTSWWARRSPAAGARSSRASSASLRTRWRCAPGSTAPARSASCCAQVRATALDAFTHQDLPFEKLVEVLKPPRNLAHSPVFQVLFVLQNAPWEAERFGDLRVSPAEIAPGDTARFDLSVSAAEFEGRLWLGLEYSTDLFDGGTIERLATGFEALLEAIVAEPGAAASRACPCRRRPTWSASSTLAAGADPDRCPASTGCLPPRSGARRRPSPSSATGVRLTYAALDARAGDIAARLLARGHDRRRTGRDLPGAFAGHARRGARRAARGRPLPAAGSRPTRRRAAPSCCEDSGARLLLARRADRSAATAARCCRRRSGFSRDRASRIESRAL